jgi:GTP-binding protein HflX
MAETKPPVILAAVQLPESDDVAFEGSLNELARLVDTLGFKSIARVTQRRRTPDPNVLFGDGKLRELAALTGGTGVVPSDAPRKTGRRSADREDLAEEDEEADLEDDAAADARPEPIAKVIVVDHDLSPSQIRNLERATEAQVLDRAGVIVEIFHRHARSREAKLQVEIARLTYLAPRVRESGDTERQRGGIGGKGAGESALELDRRKIRDRIAELRRELAEIQDQQSTRRSRRSDAPRVALVGYTNAGKSSMMRALTGSEVYIEDKLFATLDTTVRALQPETTPRILVSDTVGFIKKLPHDLVASFRSTLDESLEAGLLLYVVDSSDPTFRDQLQVTQTVLGEIGANEVPYRLILNKIDKVSAEQRAALAEELPDAVQVSAKDPAGVDQVRQLIRGFFRGAQQQTELFVPWDRQAVIGDIRTKTEVIDEAFTDEGVRFMVVGSAAAVARIQSLLT